MKLRLNQILIFQDREYEISNENQKIRKERQRK